MKCEKCESPIIVGYFEVDGCSVYGDYCDNCKTVANLRPIMEEPRYHVFKTHVFDRWLRKDIDCKDMILGHACSWELPERYIPINDRMSNEAIKAIPDTSRERMLASIKK